MNSTSWSEKYKPQKPSDIVCNVKAINQIGGWITSFETIKDAKLKAEKNKKKGKKEDTIKPQRGQKSCLLVTGNHGVGKTLAVKLILAEKGYQIKEVSLNDIKVGKNLKEAIEKLVNSSDIMSMISGEKKNKVAVVVDELESITSSTDKNAILQIQKLNSSNW